MAAQFSPRNGRRRLGPCMWIARATSSLPVPLSPRIMTGRSVAATFSMRLNTAWMPGDRPTRFENDRRASAAAGEPAILALEPHAHARVLDGQCGLIGERFHEPEVVLREQPAVLPAVQVDRADHPPRERSGTHINEWIW
jgi:hypothetical protein